MTNLLFWSRVTGADEIVIVQYELTSENAERSSKLEIFLDPTGSRGELHRQCCLSRASSGARRFVRSPKPSERAASNLFRRVFLAKDLHSRCDASASGQRKNFKLQYDISNLLVSSTTKKNSSSSLPTSPYTRYMTVSIPSTTSLSSK